MVSQRRSKSENASRRIVDSTSVALHIRRHALWNAVYASVELKMRQSGGSKISRRAGEEKSLEVPSKGDQKLKQPI
jgi:hypothetical protein